MGANRGAQCQQDSRSKGGKRLHAVGVCGRLRQSAELLPGQPVRAGRGGGASPSSAQVDSV